MFLIGTSLKTLNALNAKNPTLRMDRNPTTFFRRTPNSRSAGRFRRHQLGQGTLEYILVLVVVIIIILGLMYQFHSSFRNYAQQFFDGYIACLLEVGELPGT